MSIRLYFSNCSVSNTTLSCDSLGIHYTVSKTGPITTVTRWDSKSDSNVFVGEFYRPLFKPHKIRIGQDGEWQVLKEFLYKSGSRTITCARSFEANNGVHYRWKTRKMKWVLTRASTEGDQETLLTYFENTFSPGPPYLEVSDLSIISGLDNIILTFLIMEKQSREDSGS